MTESAAASSIRCLPHVRIRQWVLSLPYRLRHLLAWNHVLWLIPTRSGARPSVRFVQLQPDADVTAENLIALARENLPRFAAPKTLIFGPPPTTATGKIQKYELREGARTL